LPDVSTVLVCYYLLGGYTAAPSGLYARLCHAFPVAIEKVIPENIDRAVGILFYVP